MKECPNCKKTFSDADAFCTECGTSLVDMAPPSSEPTVVIPPLPIETAPAVPAAPAPAKKSKGPTAAIVALAVCLALAAGAAGFAGYEALQYKDKYETEQDKRMAAESEQSDIQKELDKLQLSHDDTASALEDANRQLEDVRSQLADVSGQLSDGSSQLDLVQGELDGLLDRLSTGYGYSSRNYFASKGVLVLRPNSSETVSIFADYPGSVTYTYSLSSSGISGQWNGSFVDGQSSITVTGVWAGYHTVHLTNNYNSEEFDILVIVTD